MSVGLEDRPVEATDAESVHEPVVADPIDAGEQLAAAALVIATMAVIATLGFRTVFSTLGYLSASVAGAALGALVVMIGRRFRLLFGEVVGVALIAPMVVGPIATGGTGFYRGVVLGWTDILSATPPIDATPALEALPFVAAFLGALIGTELFRIRELPGIAVAGPLATLAATALFSEQTRNGALGVGLVLLVGMLVLARLHYASLSSTGVLVLGFVIALVVALASTATLLLPYADESARFDLRELQEAPWDPLALPSPLTQIKAGLKSTEDDEALLRITGSEPVARWRTASLPAFNGIYWGVSEPDAITEFVPVDTTLPAIEDEVLERGTLRFNVDVLEPMGTWVPTAGVPVGIDFRDVTDARMSLATGTIGVPEELQPGNSYELEVVPWAEVDDAELSSTVFAADVHSTELEALPPLVRNLAADFSTGLDQLSGRRVIAIRDNLRLGSYDLELAPGHSFGRIAEFLQPVQLATTGRRDDSDLRSLVAYEELYAATAGLLTRLSDIPTRVAVGFVLPEDRWHNRSAEVFASDVNAWIEVFVDGRGWVPIDVTPDRERQPEEVDEGVETEGVPVADPPKSPPEPEDDEEPEIEEFEEQDEDREIDDEEDEEPEIAGLSVGRFLGVAAASAFGLGLLVLGAVVAAKAWRRRRRRSPGASPARRIAGAWAELIDRFDESGGHLPATATPHEAAAHARALHGLEDPDMAGEVAVLADQVSAAAFHPRPPTPAAADRAWQSYDRVAAHLRQTAGRAERLKRVLDPRTLREDDRMGVR